VTEQLTIQDLEFDLPKEQIAKCPASPRSSAKLLVVKESTFEDYSMQDFPQLLPKDALLIANETSVLPARFMAVRKETLGKVEGLFLEEIARGWSVMLKSNGKLRVGITLQIADGIDLTLLQKSGAHWICSCSSTRSAQDILMECGTTPIPPYIVRARGDEVVLDSIDREDYQTVFADPTKCESVAAPTAGLHFDNSLLSELTQAGIERVNVTLHVGAGTFKGIETQNINDHVMHHELWAVSQATLEAIARAKDECRPIIAVGTTTVRTLESLPPKDSWPTSGGLSGSTDLLITPPYSFQLVDGILTNFHLPKSTLLALVAAKIGIERLHACYKKAIASDYRFYSFGDAMFILP